MAEVLLAMMDAGGGARRLAVLKRIWPELATDPDFVTMFLDEARLALRLNHPNVVQTYEVWPATAQLHRHGVPRRPAADARPEPAAARAERAEPAAAAAHR